MPSPRDSVATYWRCHYCNNENLWQITPACTTCDHRRCSNCVAFRNLHPSGRTMEASGRTTTSANASTRTTLVVQQPGVPHDSKEEQKPFWKCHRCLTQCPQGDDKEEKTWNCRVCRHRVCWECSASFEDAATGMHIPALRAVLGPNPAAENLSARLLRGGDEPSAEAATEYIFQPDASLSDAMICSSTASGSFTTADKASTLDVDAPRRKSSPEQISDKKTHKELRRMLDANTQALEFLQLEHNELLATFALQQMPNPPVEQETVVSAGSIHPVTRKTVINQLMSKSTELTTGSDARSSESSERERIQDTFSKAASSPLEEKVAQLSLRSFYKRQIHQHSSPIDERFENTGSEADLDTPCESDAELDLAGTGSSDGSHADPADLFDPALVCEIVNKLTRAYLEDVKSRHAGQKQHGTTSGNASVSHNLVDATPPAANSTGANQKGSSTKRGNAEERDESVDEEPSNKRSKIGGRSEGRKLFACPYWKSDKRRYTEHNMNEKHYRHCSSTYSLDIHRLKWHLYRVHTRPDFYCSRCFLVHEFRELFDDHIRAIVPCHITDCPFGEKMTHDQMAAIKKRATTRDQVAIWYSIYEILFPGSTRPDSPYWEDISPEGVEDFEQWFIRQDFVLRDLFATRVASDLPHLPPEVRNILDTILEGCLVELVRTRGRDFHLSFAQAGPSNLVAAEFETHGTTALEVARELEMLDPHTPPRKPRTDQNFPGEASDDIQEEYIADNGMHEFCDDSSPIHTPRASPSRTQNSFWKELTTEDWAIFDSSLPVDDNFGEYWEALSHDVNLTTVLQQNQSDDEPPEITTEDVSCAKIQKGKERAQERDECFGDSGERFDIPCTKHQHKLSYSEKLQRAATLARPSTILLLKLSETGRTSQLGSSAFLQCQGRGPILRQVTLGCVSLLNTVELTSDECK